MVAWIEVSTHVINYLHQKQYKATPHHAKYNGGLLPFCKFMIEFGLLPPTRPKIVRTERRNTNQTRTHAQNAHARATDGTSRARNG
jgi:hypothetical protein